MLPLTDNDIRHALVNASRGEAKRAVLPDLSTVDWDALDYLGWTDAKRELVSYVTLFVDDQLVTIQLRRTSNRTRRRLVCTWCQDVVAGDRAMLFVAARAGASGRNGNTIGTAICADFRCSANARRTPSITEMSSDDDAEVQFWIDLRVEELRRRSARFARQVMAG